MLSTEGKETKKEKSLNFAELVQAAANPKEKNLDWGTVKEWKAKIIVNLIIRSTSSGKP